MGVQYFTPELDPLQTVYEVDFDKGTWRIFGAPPNKPHTKGWLIEGGDNFKDLLQYRRLVRSDDPDGDVVFDYLGSCYVH